MLAEFAEDNYHRLLRIPPAPASKDVMGAIQGLSPDVQRIGDNR